LFIVCREIFTELLNKAIFKEFGYNGTNSYPPKIYTCETLVIPAFDFGNGTT